MRQSQESPHAAALEDEIWRSIQDFEPSTDTERAIYAQELERIHDLGQDGETRLLNAREGLSPMLGVVLISIGIDTILFTFFVGMKSAWLHTNAVAAFTGAIALMLYAIVSLDQPFGTDLRAGPDAFELVSQTIEGNGEQQT